MYARRVVPAVALAAVFAVALPACETAPETEAKKATLDSAVQASRDAFVNDDPTLQNLLDQAAGYVIFPEVGKAGFIVGGSHGRGQVFERGNLIGYADITQGTVGLQAGAQTFSELVVFTRQEDLDQFKEGEFALAANVSAVAIKPGAAASADYSKGVIVFVRTTGGLMAEAAIGGQRFRFTPL